jgi:hypothetical protein
MNTPYSNGISKSAHVNNDCHVPGQTVTIEREAHAAINRVASSYGLSGQAMLDRLIIAAESNAIEVAKTLPNGQACYNACELKFGASQQGSILNAVEKAKWFADRMKLTIIRQV